MLRKIGIFIVICAMCLLLVSCNGVSEYQLNFIVDGEVYATVLIDEASELILPEDPSKEGYAFDGWFFDDEIWEDPLSKDSLIESDVSVYAKWKKLDGENQEQNQVQNQGNNQEQTQQQFESHTCVASEWIEDTPATCKASGTRHKECTVCKEVLESGSIERLSTHREGERTIDEKTGGFCGQSGTYSQTVFCKDCGIEISHSTHELPQKHQMKDGACEICGLPQSTTKGMSFYLKSDGTYIASTSSMETVDENVVIGVYNDLTVSEINGGAFSEHTEVKSIVIADCVTVLDKMAFYNCPSLTTVVIGKGIKEIPEQAFMGCNSLRYVTIGENVEEIGFDAFKGCDNLYCVYMSEDHDWYRQTITSNKQTVYGKWISSPYTAADYLKEYNYRWTRK